MTSEAPAYGLWSLVVINVAAFAIFAFSFTHPRTARDWRPFGAFTAFLVALFTEMYALPAAATQPVRIQSSDRAQKACR